MCQNILCQISFQNSLIIDKWVLLTGGLEVLFSIHLMSSLASHEHPCKGPLNVKRRLALVLLLFYIEKPYFSLLFFYFVIALAHFEKIGGGLYAIWVVCQFVIILFSLNILCQCELMDFPPNFIYMRGPYIDKIQPVVVTCPFCILVPDQQSYVP